MGESISERVGAMLRRQGWKLAVAESCTGGLAGSQITDVPGASEYFVGGVVAYANDIKRNLLGVAADTLQQHGAVSEETVREMAAGVRRRTAADIGLAITGIAGPGGAVEGKPVGTVWLALSSAEGEWTRNLHLTGTRTRIKTGAVEAVFLLLEEYLLREES